MNQVSGSARSAVSGSTYIVAGSSKNALPSVWSACSICEATSWVTSVCVVMDILLFSGFPPYLTQQHRVLEASCSDNPPAHCWHDAAEQEPRPAGSIYSYIFSPSTS